MNPAQHRRIMQVFQQAIELDPGDRDGFLAEACGSDPGLREEVEALLNYDEQSGDTVPGSAIAVGRQLLDAARDTPQLSSDPGGPLPSSIGSYRPTRIIGQGGMGTVYEAEQERPQRRVALKVIKPGMMSRQALRRFELEADILGRLEHAGIARIYEAGTHEAGEGAQPFFAMEFIEGEPFTAFADKHALGTRQRLELVAKICKGVHHAHQKGIVHRDLKPGNILVDATGQPKILDFGVARATDSDIQTTTQRTDVGQLVGTVPYMSPEQAGGDPTDLDARSDVYALGVVAYELLAGRLPYDLRNKMLHDAVRVIREDDPTPLSSLNRVFRGDVEVIIGKALEKEKDRRYQSATELASDIERYLGDQPVVARRPSAVYQLRKFAKRNKVLAAAFIVLLIGAAGTTWQAIAATRQRNRANQEAWRAEREADRAIKAEAEQTLARRRAEEALGKAEAINDFVKRALVSSDPHQGGAQTLQVMDAMTQAIALLDGEQLQDQPETEAALRMTIAQILNGNGRQQEALGQARAALEINQSLYPGDHRELVDNLKMIADCLVGVGQTEAALSRYQEGLEMARRLFEGDHASVAGNLSGVALCLEALGRSDEAIQKHQAVLEMQRRLNEGDHAELAKCLNNVAYSMESLGRFAEALSLYEEALELRRRLYPGDYPAVATSLNNFAACTLSLGRAADALPLYQAALDMRQRLFPRDHPMVASSLRELAYCLQALGRSQEALPQYQAALEMRQRLYDGDHPDVARSLNSVGYCLNALGRYEEALGWYQQTLDMRRRLFTSDHPAVANSLNNVASCLRSMRRFEEALPILKAALEMRQTVHDGDHPDVASGFLNLANCLVSMGKKEEGLPLLEAALEMRQRIYGDDHPAVGNSLSELAYCLKSMNRTTDALPLFEASLAILQTTYPGDHPRVAQAMHNLATCMSSAGRSKEALPVEQEAHAMLQRVLPAGHPNLLHTQFGVARILGRLDRYAEAEQLLLDAAAQCEQSARIRRIHWRSLVGTMIRFYESWHEIEPGEGYDRKAGEWRERKAGKAEVTSQPT